MNKKTLQKLKEKLEKEKVILEQQLKSFAKKDPKLKGDWDTQYPYFDGEIGGAALEKAADEVEEYSIRLPIEFSLESKLRDVDLALEKMKKGKYGICEKCGKEIDKKRLVVCPEARFCLNCQK